MAATQVVQEWVLLLVACAAALLMRWFKNSRQSGTNNKGKLRLAPGPPRLPVLGNLSVLVASRQPHQALHRLAQQYGPIMSLRLGSKEGLVVSSPEMAKEVLKTFDKQFANRPLVTAKNTLAYGEKSMGFASYSSRLQFARKIAILELLSPKRIQQFVDVRAEETSRMLRSILEDSQSSPVINMNQRSSYLVMNMVTRILVSKTFFLYAPAPGSCGQEVASEFKELLDEVFVLAGVTLIGDLIPQLGFLDRIMNYKAAMQRAHRRMNTFLDALLEEHRHGQQQEQDGDHGRADGERDFLDILLSLPGDDGAQKLDDESVKAQLFDMMSAGIHTSSGTIEWSLAELLRNPEVMVKAQAELDRVVGRDRVVEESDVAQLPYLQCVVKEVLRLHTPAPLLAPHFNSEACRIAGYHIPAHTTTFVNAWSIARNPEVWGDTPLQFLPDRFADRDLDVRGKHFELLPFGAGRRGCPGTQLGLTVVHYGLARLLHSFHWSLPRGQAPQDLDMTEKFGLTLSRASPLRAIPRPRLPPHLY